MFDMDWNYEDVQKIKKKSISDILSDKLAENSTLEHLCEQLIQRAMDGDNQAFKMIKDIVGEFSGIVEITEDK